MRTKVLLTVGVVIVVMLLSFFLIIGMYLTKVMVERESEFIISQSKLALTSLESTLSGVPAATRDWASWDETYSYVLGENATFAQDKITEYPLELYRLNIMAIVDNKGKIINELFYDYERSEYMDPLTDLSVLYPSLARKVQSSFVDADTVNLTDTLQIGQAGFVMLNGKVYYLSAFPIIHSDETGPCVGTFIFGRVIDVKTQLASIESDAHIEISMYNTQSDFTEEQQDKLINDSFLETTDAINETITGYYTIHDIFANPSLALGVTQPRSLYLASMKINTLVFAILTVVGLVFFLLVLILLNKMILNPLQTLTHEVELVADNTKTYVEATGEIGTEIHFLSNSINNMLSRLVKGNIQLKESNETLKIYSNAVESASDDIIIYDNENRIRYANASFLSNMGYTLEEMQHTDILSLFRSEDIHFVVQSVFHTLGKRESWHGDLKFLRHDQSLSLNSVRFTPIISENDTLTHFLLIMHNIETHRHYEEMLLHMAQFDPLTELPNRHLFIERLGSCIAKAQNNSLVAVVLLDIDGFKIINETYGHSAGDRVLYSIAERLAFNFSDIECIARLGGDEFALLLTDVKIGEVEMVADTLLKIFRMPLELNSVFFNLTVSLGTCLYPYDGATAEIILKNADAALYQAKADGKNMHIPYTADLSTMIQKRFDMEYAMREAIENKGFVAYYQPIVHAGSGKVIACEALIRWLTPDGIIPPDAFITLAEDTGLILPITRLMLLHAREAHKHYANHGYIMQISVNVPAQVLLHNDFMDLIEEAIQGYGKNDVWLEIEITEGTLVTEIEKANSILTKLSNMGITVLMDDFGTGYSSLSYLKKISIDIIKIDKSFVSSLPHDQADAAIVRAVINIANGNVMKTVAEGVETREQLDYLEKNGCHYIQGYFVSRPIPQDQFLTFLQNWKGFTF